ncbi:hypothetical protein SAMN05216207_106915 [Pseudonocardia ammonioxydans]|uniref:Uncharacterized protein n=1 Tax=Pseudonocardia ammonioxydans TaxID=260086 RepID=A0A1I5HNJ7_PSUAM|nr:hypothetical protein [Pseudonocardia ammonioxydans]SFO49391.1 hypothetical protein SAMN05216207_106915 [Pseudonocardia ammonioxydans]
MTTIDDTDHTPAPPAAVASEAAWDVVHEWYHSAFTGCVLYLVAHKGTDVAARTVYEVFARQRQNRFLPGLRRLGIDGLPAAVAAAQYHYLSNNIGGVSVEYMPESDRKAWIRYRAPRWIWSGTALCGIPTEVSRAMLLGWHAQNGVSLGNPRLGFVCTKQTTDGQSSLEGYYYEYDQPLAPEQRLRFARDEQGPVFDPAQAPVLPDADWPAERVMKARRNYAMEYVRTLLPAAVDVLGPGEAEGLLTVATRMVGLQHYHHSHRLLLGTEPDGSLEGFVRFVQSLATAQGDEISTAPSAAAGGTDAPAGTTLTQHGWRLYPDGQVHDSVATIWNGLLEGAAMAHDGRIQLDLIDRGLAPDPRFTWQARPAAHTRR